MCGVIKNYNVHVRTQKERAITSSFSMHKKNRITCVYNNVAGLLSVLTATQVAYDRRHYDCIDFRSLLFYYKYFEACKGRAPQSSVKRVGPIINFGISIRCVRIENRVVLSQVVRRDTVI